MRGENVHHFRKEPQGPKDGVRGLGSRLFHTARRGGIPRLSESTQGENITVGLQAQPPRIDSRLIDTSLTAPLGVEGLRAQLDQQPASSMNVTDISDSEIAPSETLSENANSLADTLPYTSVEESGGVDGLRTRLDSAEKRNKRKRRGKMTATVVLGALVPALAATACSGAPSVPKGTQQLSANCISPDQETFQNPVDGALATGAPIQITVDANQAAQAVVFFKPGQAGEATANGLEIDAKSDGSMTNSNNSDQSGIQSPTTKNGSIIEISESATVHVEKGGAILVCVYPKNSKDPSSIATTIAEKVKDVGLTNPNIGTLGPGIPSKGN